MNDFSTHVPSAKIRANTIYILFTSFTNSCDTKQKINRVEKSFSYKKKKKQTFICQLIRVLY